MPAADLPDVALSVRQPWAWAIVAGFKEVENRSEGSIRAGQMTCRRIAIHAAAGMTRKEYEWAVWRLDRHGVRCPAALDLPRGAIIGAVDVVAIVTDSESEWFGGQMGLVLENAVMCDPIPAKGALGYFPWARAEALAAPLPWMRKAGDGTGELFPDLNPSFDEPPKKPFGD